MLPVQDIEAVDPDFYKNLAWMLDNSIEGVLDLTFTEESDYFGRTELVELKPGGTHLRVTDATKRECVLWNAPKSHALMHTAGRLQGRDGPASQAVGSLWSSMCTVALLHGRRVALPHADDAHHPASRQELRQGCLPAAVMLHSKLTPWCMMPLTLQAAGCRYVDLVAQHRMTTAIKEQITAFLAGFWELIPKVR